MLKQQADLSEVSVRLLANGRYIWTISSSFSTKTYPDSLETIKQIDNSLRNKFPDHVKRGSGRTAYIDPDETPW